MWWDRFDLSLKFIIESVSLTAKRAAGYEDQPNALLMRHSETHIHTQIHTRCSHYVQICGLRPPCPAPPLPNECQCCVYGCGDVRWFLPSSLVKPSLNAAL